MLLSNSTSFFLTVSLFLALCNSFCDNCMLPSHFFYNVVLLLSLTKPLKVCTFDYSTLAKFFLFFCELSPVEGQICLCFPAKCMLLLTMCWICKILVFHYLNGRIILIRWFINFVWHVMCIGLCFTPIMEQFCLFSLYNEIWNYCRCLL